MEKNKLIRLMIFSSIGSSVIGLPYICNLLDNVHILADKWGILSVFIGLVLLCSTVAIDNLKDRTAQYLLATEFSVLALLQILPIYHWLSAHKSAVFVTTAGNYTAHWGFSVPHIILLSVGLLIVYHIFNNHLIVKNTAS